MSYHNGFKDYCHVHPAQELYIGRCKICFPKSLLHGRVEAVSPEQKTVKLCLNCLKEHDAKGDFCNAICYDEYKINAKRKQPVKSIWDTPTEELDWDGITECLKEISSSGLMLGDWWESSERAGMILGPLILKYELDVSFSYTAGYRTYCEYNTKYKDKISNRDENPILAISLTVIEYYKQHVRGK